MPGSFADVAVPVAVDTLFTYRIPDELRSLVKRGMQVVVPFGKRSVTGIVVNISETPPPVRHIKPIADIVDLEPVISGELLKLTEWMAQYYFAPWGEVLRSALVPGS